MKKLLGLLAVAPMAITACGGGSAAKGLHGTAVNGATGMFDGLMTGAIDIAGNWSDARYQASDTSTVYEDVVAIGITEHRISNDGLQANKDMSEQDIFHVQAMFQALVKDADATVGTDADADHILDVYGHTGYDNIIDTTKKVSYLKDGVPAEKEMTNKVPAAGAGTLFDDQGQLTNTETLNIEFIPSTDPTKAVDASKALEQWIIDNYGGTDSTVNVSVAADYNAAGVSLENGSSDLAFLSVNTWTDIAPSANFILQSGREAQVATLDLDEHGDAVQPSTITNQPLTTSVINRFSQLYVEEVTTNVLDNTPEADLSDAQLEFKASMVNYSDPFYTWANAVNDYADIAFDTNVGLVAGSYESYIWARTGSTIANRVLEQYNTASYDKDWTIDISDLSLTYGYTSTTSSSTMVFPSLWLKKHLGSTPQ